MISDPHEFFLDSGRTYFLVDSELGEDRCGQILEAGGLLGQRSVDQENSRHRLVIHTVVAAPPIGVVFDDLGREFAHRRSPGGPGPLGVAHHQVGTDVEVATTLVDLLTLVDLGDSRLAGDRIYIYSL